jgi:hypothetical protein
MYWDVRQAALLALAKLGSSADLALLTQITEEGSYQFGPAAVAYAEARLAEKAYYHADTVVADAENLLSRLNEGYLAPHFAREIGLMRWSLELVLTQAEGSGAVKLRSLIAKYCLRMSDWTRVLKLFGTSSLSANPDDSLVPDVQVNVAAALVLAKMQAAALCHLYPIYDRLSASNRCTADAVLWDALHSVDFIGPTHYLWALGVILDRAVSATTPETLLKGLHRLARVMEPVGQKDMMLWLRHTLRAEAPGYYYGDSHDRLNYVRTPDLPPDFQRDLNLLCDEYKPRILERLSTVLRSERSIGRHADSARSLPE